MHGAGAGVGALVVGGVGGCEVGGAAVRGAVVVGGVLVSGASVAGAPVSGAAVLGAPVSCNTGISVSFTMDPTSSSASVTAMLHIVQTTITVNVHFDISVVSCEENCLGSRGRHSRE